MANPWGQAGKPVPVSGLMADYVALPSIGCPGCGLTFSAVVGRLHHERTGHAVTEAKAQLAAQLAAPLVRATA